MSSVTLTHTDTITVDLAVRRTWSLLSTGRIGEASFTIPAGTPAAKTDYLNADAGSLVRIGDEDGGGAWNGVVTRLSHDERGVTVTASQPAIILSRIPVALNRTFKEVAVRHVVAEVFRNINAITGTYPLVTGAVSAGTNLIPTYQMHGEDCWSVLQSMMAVSGQELHAQTGTDNDKLTWGSDYGAVEDGVLMAPGQFRDAVYGLDITEQVSKVTALSDRKTFSVTSPDIAVNRWPAHLIVKSALASNLRSLAEAEIGRRLVPAVRVEGSVPRDYWHLREGDYLRVLIPWARFTGATVLARITSREIAESGDVMRLELQTAAGQQSTNKILDDLTQIVRAESGGRGYLVGAN